MGYSIFKSAHFLFFLFNRWKSFLFKNRQMGTLWHVMFRFRLAFCYTPDYRVICRMYCCLTLPSFFWGFHKGTVRWCWSRYRPTLRQSAKSWIWKWNKILFIKVYTHGYGNLRIAIYKDYTIILWFGLKSSFQVFNVFL